MKQSLRIVLDFLGVLFLLAIFALGGIYIYTFSPGTDKVNQATPEQVKFVLNWGGIKGNQDYSVVFSYEQRNHFLPDHLVYYCLQLSDLSVDERQRDDWKVGPETNPVFSGVIDIAANSGKSNECFTNHAQPNSKEVQTLFWAVHTHGRFPAGAQVLLYETSSRRLLYVDYET